jgi:hypothetical protein
LSDVVATPERIAEVAERLRQAGESLVARPATEIVRTLGSVGVRFLDSRDELRAEALERLPSASGFSREMTVAVLDGMAADWTADRLRSLVEAELGDPAVLDSFVDHGGRRTMAVGPALCVQVVAGSVPGVGVSALVRSLLVKGPTLLKPGRGDAVLPELFARGLRELDAALGEALEVCYWPGGTAAVEGAALARADVVTAYGSDESVGTLRALTPVTARFVAYHHRVSVGVVGREALARGSVAGTSADVARAVALFDQRGCVSPQLVFVEEGGDLTPADFTDALARALAELEGVLPAGALGLGEASRLQQARGTAELLEGSGVAKVVHGGASTWTVVLGHDVAGDVSPGGRYLRVRPVSDAEQVPALLEPLASHLQTVGVAGLGSRVGELAKRLGRVGASRITSFDRVPFPPPWWHHDGRGPLRDLVRWVDLEG